MEKHLAVAPGGWASRVELSKGRLDRDSWLLHFDLRAVGAIMLCRRGHFCFIFQCRMPKPGMPKPGMPKPFSMQNALRAVLRSRYRSPRSEALAPSCFTLRELQNLAGPARWRRQRLKHHRPRIVGSFLKGTTRPHRFNPSRPKSWCEPVQQQPAKAV